MLLLQFVSLVHAFVSTCVSINLFLFAFPFCDTFGHFLLLMDLDGGKRLGIFFKRLIHYRGKQDEKEKEKRLKKKKKKKERG